MNPQLPDALPLAAGTYTGRIAAEADGPEARAALADLPRLLAAGEVLHAGRNRVVRVRFAADGRAHDWAVKSFGVAFRIGRSKAQRSWDAARRLTAAGGGITPPPVALLERRAGRRMRESYFITRFADGVVSLRDELIRLYAAQPTDCATLMERLQTAAAAVRALHDAGVLHHDPGNQNILLRPGGGALLVDLNRARFFPMLRARRRARDLSRISLPSDLLRIFFEMYWGGPPPAGFQRWEKFYRARFALHTRTRRWRHPLRERRAPRGPAYPPPREIWIWDDRSGQAISPWTARDRRRLACPGDTLRAAAATLRAAPAMCRAYRRLLAEAYKQPVDLAGRIGVAAHLRGATAEMEGQRLAELSPTPLPVLVRFYAHETPSARAAVAERARALAARGHALTLALVQDRAAVRDPARWMEFASDVLSRLHDVAEAVEVAHAVNRVKWGFWTLAEYRRLMDATARLRAQYPRPAWLGPAGIDFEYPRMAGFLRALPAGMRFDALSHHLYVDRRGAPENRQAGFATLGKLALARALAEAHPAQCGARLIVSEFNWPLDDTGVYSPVGSPYLYPGQTLGAPQVGAEQAAAYLLRYLLIALCSGLAERVFWWRLAAHGYGLCDDRTPELPPRPGYRALQFFLRETRGAHFTRRCPMPPGAAGFLFEQPDGTRKIWAYAHPAPARWTPDFPFTAVSGLGAPLASKNPTITLNEMPALVSGREGSLSESLSVSGSE